jgi:ribosomal protein S18 acetylase RimI-like enzyme
MGHSGGHAIAIRPGEFDDVEAILAIEIAVFPGDRLSRRALARFLRAPNRPLIVATVGSELAGYALMSLRRNGRVARLYSIAVDPRFSRRGVARALIQACEVRAHDDGREAMTLEVRYDNPRAIALYEGLGYRSFGEYPGYYEDGGAAVRYRKALDRQRRKVGD